MDYYDVFLRRNADRPCRAATPSPPKISQLSRYASDGAFNCLRLPREGHTGRWRGEPGRSGWRSDLDEVRGITGDKPVIFRNNYPDFTPWSQAFYYDETLNGTDLDFRLADAHLAETRPDLHLGYATDAAAYRQRHALTWHHHEDGVTLLLVPRALHENIPHAGGASLLRYRRWAQELYERQNTAEGSPRLWQESAESTPRLSDIPFLPPPKLSTSAPATTSVEALVVKSGACSKSAPRTFNLRSSGV